MKLRRNSGACGTMGLVVLALSAAVLPSCAEPLDTTRQLPERGTVGEEMFGVICDRVGAQALREDLTGASFRGVCHRSRGGEFADKVDQDALPAIDDSARNEKGDRVSVEDQRAHRDRAVGRIEALGRRRADLIRAFDATFRAEQLVGIKDLDAKDATKSCEAPKKSGEGKLTDALADMLGRMGGLYDDGTLPYSTESLARVVQAFKDDPDAQAAYARMSGREGYRPIATSLGITRPAVAYPHLRDLANASLRLLSADSNPYGRNPRKDAQGRRVPEPGPGNAALNKMLEAAHEELLDAAADPAQPRLTVTTEPDTGRVILSRPRGSLEVLNEVVFTTDPAFSSGAPRFIVRRDARGYAAISDGTVPAPFLDKDKDGLPDVDDRGRFVTANGSVPPSPFAFPGGPDGPRDKDGRALAGSRLLYSYVDTSQTFASQMLRDMRALADPDPEREALMGAVGGIYVAMGRKGPQTKSYANKTVEYQGYVVDTSPMLDLVHGFSAILGDRTMDGTLAMLKAMVQTQEPSVARVTGAMLKAQDVAKKHDEAKVPRTMTFWDESLDIMGEMAKVYDPATGESLMEDMLAAFANPDVQPLGDIFSNYAQYKDELSYDPNDLNGTPKNLTRNDKSDMRTPVDRAQPQIGKNRSGLNRFLQLIVDTTGVTACNKPNAKVHAQGTPIGDVTLPVGGGTFQECEVFKIENLGGFYLDAIAGISARRDGSKPGFLYIRDNFMRDGLGGVGAATVDVMEQSSGLVGFWGTKRDLRPRPEWLNRLVFFDLKNDSPNDGDRNYTTNYFLRELQGDQIGTANCPERTINDPLPNAVDASPDGKVHGLRNCPDGQWLAQRGKGTIFVWENFGFYQALRPLAAAFVKWGREDLFLALAQAAYKHYPDENATPAECELAGGKQCSKAGALTYEPLLGEMLAGDLIPAMHELTKGLGTLPITRCIESDGASRACLKTEQVSAIRVAADAARAALDPTYARDVIRLKDRRGGTKAKRNDGTEGGQVTPAYLIANALSAIDATFDAYEAETGDTERRLSWRKARSHMADVFLGVNGGLSSSSFKDPTMAKMTPVLVDLLRAQLLARCPRSFTPPYDRCVWARDDIPEKAAETLSGPLVASGLEMAEAIRKDPEGRKQMALMVQYMMDAASENDALANALASATDVMQLLQDDKNLVPFYRVVAQAVDASTVDASGAIVEKSLVDAQMALLARVSGRYFDDEGKEICAREVDPNEILSKVLKNAVTPIEDADFKGQTPLEVIIDVIADVNRQDPTQPYSGSLAQADYGFVSENVVDFLTNKERGLEQFYEIVRNGVK